MSKHTPGPWFAMTGDTGGLVDQANVFSEHEIDGEPTFIADTMGVDDDVPLEQRRANALLIAAAPNLLAALKAAHEALLGDAGLYESTGFGGRYVIEIVEAAIVEAEGAILSSHTRGEAAEKKGT